MPSMDILMTEMDNVLVRVSGLWVKGNRMGLRRKIDQLMSMDEVGRVGNVVILSIPKCPSEGGGEAPP